MDYTIKETSQRSSLSTDTLRYYDKLGIVVPKRRENGYRYYDENDLSVLQYVSLMKYAQFSLEEIKLVVNMFGDNSGIECKKVTKKILATKVIELHELVSNYQTIIDVLNDLNEMVDETNAQCVNRPKILNVIETVNNQIVRK